MPTVLLLSAKLAFASLIVVRIHDTDGGHAKVDPVQMKREGR